MPIEIILWLQVWIWRIILYKKSGEVYQDDILKDDSTYVA